MNNKDELIEECLRQYREIDEMVMKFWNDETGGMIHRIIDAECGKIEHHRLTHQEKTDD